MRQRAFRISLLALTALWFGVVVPLHPRGVIKLAGGARADAKACCHPGKPAAPDSKPLPDTSDCAVCHFLATLDLPPAAGTDLADLGLHSQVIPPAPQAAPIIASTDSSAERAPPIA